MLGPFQRQSMPLSELTVQQVEQIFQIKEVKEFTSFKTPGTVTQWENVPYAFAQKSQAVLASVPTASVSAASILTSLIPMITFMWLASREFLH